MQLKVTTDYAIRLILALSGKPEKRTAEELSTQMKIPRPTVIKIMNKLKASGWVTSREGLHGGYTLAAPIQDITLLDVFSAMEETIKINRCLEEDAYCSRFGTRDCPVRETYSQLQGVMEGLFQSLTLEKILARDLIGIEVAGGHP